MCLEMGLSKPGGQLTMKRLIVALFFLSLVLVDLTRSSAPAMTQNPAPISFVHHPTSTDSPAAQACFDRGLTLYYAYNRLASQRAFECAAKADPSFAMAYWGIALVPCGR